MVDYDEKTYCFSKFCEQKDCHRHPSKASKGDIHSYACFTECYYWKKAASIEWQMLK